MVAVGGRGGEGKGGGERGVGGWATFVWSLFK